MQLSLNLLPVQEIAPYLRVLGCYPMYTGLKMTSEPPPEA